MIEDEKLLFWLGRVVLDVLLGELGVQIDDDLVLAADVACSQDFADLSEDQLLQLTALVAQQVFNDNTITSLDDLSATIGGSFTSVVDELVQEILVYSVSSFECPHRERFVRNIMGLDEEVQSHLMNTIQSILRGAAASAEEEVVDEPAEVAEDIVEQDPITDETSEVPEEEESIPTIAPAEVTNCRRCVDLERQLDRHRAQSTNQAATAEQQAERQQLEQDMRRLRENLSSETARLVDTEVALQEKERVIKDLESQLTQVDTLHVQIHNLQTQLQDRDTHLTSMQDQCELNRSKVEKVDNLERTVTKLKDKLADLQEVRTQLKSETEHHAETYQKLIAAEEELTRLQSVEKQVEQYRAELAEQTIALSDAQARLQSTQHDLLILQRRLQSVEKGKEDLLSAQSHLAMELQATSEELRVQQRCEGLGEGMSEFNPVVMQELHRLRAENTQLHTKIDRGSLQAVEKAQKEVADLQCVVKSLQEKWMTTRDTLEDTQQQLANLQAQHEQTLEQMEEQEVAHESALESQNQSFSQTLAQEQLKLSNLQADLDQEILKRRKVERLKKLYEAETQRQRLQLQHAVNHEHSHAGEFDVAAKEIRGLQEKLDAAQAEVVGLKAQLQSAKLQGNSNAIVTSEHENNNNLANTSAAATSSRLMSKPLRIQQLQSSSAMTASSLLSASSLAQHATSSSKSSSSSSTSTSSSNNNNNNGGKVLNYAEQAELHDKHLEQLAREKRELLSRSLEENKEKLELSQRVMTLDKENAQLRAELRKRTLEKERLERAMLKSGRQQLVDEAAAEH